MLFCAAGGFFEADALLPLTLRLPAAFDFSVFAWLLAACDLTFLCDSACSCAWMPRVLSCAPDTDMPPDSAITPSDPLLALTGCRCSAFAFSARLRQPLMARSVPQCPFLAPRQTSHALPRGALV